MSPSDVDFMLDIGEGLIQGGSFRAGADARLRAVGARRMQYICSRTIYWRRLFKSHPQLEQATIRTPEDQHLVIYNNPERYAGCYNKREWLEYILSLVEGRARSGCDTIFFDNPMVWPCYCQTCRTKFRAYTKEKVGREIDIPRPGEGQDVQAVEAAKLFRLETAERFFRTVHEHARGKRPAMYITANNLCYWLVSRDVTDAVFTEGSAHPLGGGRVVVSPDPVSSTEPETLLRSIGLAADGKLRYRAIDPPPDLLLNVLDAPEANATVLHLVNYRFEYGGKFSNPKVVPAKSVVLESQGTAVPSSVLLLTVDSGSRALPVSRRGDAWRVTVPEVGIYAAVVVGKGTAGR